MRTLISILFLALVLACNLWAETPKASSFSLSGGEPLAISSEKMTLKGQENKAIFEGDVIIQKGDVKITAGRVDAQLADTKKGKEIVQIQMAEQVEIKQGDRRVIAQKGIYDTEKGEITLTGNPEMWEKGYHVQGKLIRLSLKEKRSFVEGSVLTIY